MYLVEGFKGFAFILFVLACENHGNGQSIINSTDPDPVRHLDYYWLESKTHLGINDITLPEWDDKFIQGPAPLAQIGKKLWVRISVPGLALDSTSNYVISIPGLVKGYIYYNTGDSLLLGFRAPPNRDSRVVGLTECLINLSGVEGDLYFSTAPVYYSKPLGTPTITPYKHYQAEQYFIDKSQFAKTDLFNFLFIGGMSIMIFYAMGAFLMNRKKEFLIYAVYLTLLLVYLGPSGSLFYEELHRTLSIPFLQTYLFTEGIQVAFHIIYLIFTITFLSAKSDYPWLHKIGSLTTKLLIAYLSIFTVIVSLEVPWAQITFLWERLLMGTFTLIGSVYVIYNRKDILAFLVSGGSIAFLIGSLGTLITFDILYMKTGALVEIFAFSLGLGYKMRKSDLLSIKYNKELIKQLEVNEALQRRNNEELQKEVEKRSQEIVEREIALEKQKKDNLEITLKREVDRVKMIALRAQMNPHFLFNSLNSIRALVIHQQNDEAYKYLTKFSKLIRSILENSDQELIQLEQELEILKLYLSLERMRFSDGFEFKLSVDPEIDTQSLLVPPLILQPFLENAIIHGLAPKDGPKELQVSVERKTDKLLLCAVKDNGVGRSFHLNNRLNAEKKRSMAIELTTQRVALMNEVSIEEQEMVEVFDHNGSQSGTEVRVSLPIITGE